MGAALCACSSVASLVTGTKFLPAGSNCILSGNSTEPPSQGIIRKAGTFSYLQVLADATGTARSVTFRKNTADATLVVSPTDTTAGLYIDATHQDAVAAGDQISLKSIATGAPTYFVVAMVFTAAAGHSYPLQCNCNAGAALTTASTSFFYSVSGKSAGDATEAPCKQVVRAGYTADNMFVEVDFNSRTTAVTVTLRKNGADATNTLSVGAGLTGLFEDTAHSDTFASGDTINFVDTLGTGSGSYRAQSHGVTATATGAAPTSDVYATDPSGVVVTFFASPQFLAIAGTLVTATTNEGNAKIRHGFAVIMIRMRVNISANTMTGTTTLVLRKNTVNQTNTIAIATVLTGTFEDTTHIDFAGATDDVCWAISGGTSGTITVAAFALTETEIPQTGWLSPPEQRGRPQGVTMVPYDA